MREVVGNDSENKTNGLGAISGNEGIPELRVQQSNRCPPLFVKTLKQSYLLDAFNIVHCSSLLGRLHAGPKRKIESYFQFECGNMTEAVAVEEDVVPKLRALNIQTKGDNNDGGTDDGEVHDDGCRGSKQILILDAGYGFPREKKVRKEKLNAISSQLSNFLIWQTNLSKEDHEYAIVRLVGCPDEKTKEFLENRTIENMKKASTSSKLDSWKNLPSHVSITCETLEQCLENLAPTRTAEEITTAANENNCEPVYLSPDASESLDPSSRPPDISIVGLLIDRRVQPNRSKSRAKNIGIVARRWPLEECFAEIDSNEPLNVDCILEGMQQWWWNYWSQASNNSCGISDTKSAKSRREPFIQAASQAIENHAKRHPSRPLHITKDQ